MLMDKKKKDIVIEGKAAVGVVVAEGINFIFAAELTCADISAQGYCLQVKALHLGCQDFL